MPQHNLGRSSQGQERRFGDCGEAPLDATIQNVSHRAVKTSLNRWDARGGKIIPKSEQVVSISSAPCDHVAHHQRAQAKFLKESMAIRNCP